MPNGKFAYPIKYTFFQCDTMLPFSYTHEAKIKELLCPTFEKDKLAIFQFLICRLSICRKLARLSICRLSICRLSICRLSIIRPPFLVILLTVLYLLGQQVLVGNYFFNTGISMTWSICRAAEKAEEAAEGPAAAAAAAGDAKEP